MEKIVYIDHWNSELISVKFAMKVMLSIITSDSLQRY
jgi:hypothetical protein